jgi:hypothetical protein
MHHDWNKAENRIKAVQVKVSKKCNKYNNGNDAN